MGPSFSKGFAILALTLLVVLPMAHATPIQDIVDIFSSPLRFITGFLSLYLASSPAPEIQAGGIAISPGVVGLGEPITFSVKWRSTGEKTRVLVCRSSAGLVTYGLASNFLTTEKYCSRGKWCTTGFTNYLGGSGFETTDCTFEVEDITGTVGYELYVCNTRNACSSAKLGTFRVVENTPPVAEALSVSQPALSEGKTAEFKLEWRDNNPGDRAKLFVCLSNEIPCSTSNLLCSSGWDITGTAGCSFTATRETPGGPKKAFAYVCDAAGNACSSALFRNIYMNSKPVISSTSTDAGKVAQEETLTFRAYWSDDDPAEKVKLWICRTVDFNSSIPGCKKGSADTWCSLSTIAPYNSQNPATCATEIGLDEMPGSYYYYSYVCDERGSCSKPGAGIIEIVSAGENP